MAEVIEPGRSRIEDILMNEDIEEPLSRIEELLIENNVSNVLKAGTNILITKNDDGTLTISASGEVSSEDTVARAEIAAIKDGETLDSFGDVETALGDKADKSTTYTKTEVNTALGGKVDTETGKGLSTNDYTTDEKTKLAGIEAQANKTTVDDALSDSSTNPVQNKVVKSALDSKANASTTYTKIEVDTALSGKQATLATAQLAAVNSGIDSTKVAQIQTNENNILLKIGASDYASQNTGGTVRVWTTTSGGETTLHIANEAP